MEEEEEEEEEQQQQEQQDQQEVVDLKGLASRPSIRPRALLPRISADYSSS